MNIPVLRLILHASVPRMIVTWGCSRVSLSQILTFHPARRRTRESRRLKANCRSFSYLVGVSQSRTPSIHLKHMSYFCKSQYGTFSPWRGSRSTAWRR